MDKRMQSGPDVPGILSLKDSAAKAEYETIMKVLKEVNFNKTKAAQLLHVDRKTLYNKIRGYKGENATSNP